MSFVFCVGRASAFVVESFLLCARVSCLVSLSLSLLVSQTSEKILIANKKSLSFY
jgi:hypothetical protein